MTANNTVAEIVESLSREEKIQLVHGTTDPDHEATGYIAGVERLGIPPLRLVDGPMGIRTNTETATAFPASILLAASFDPALAKEFGAALGREAKDRNQDVVLGPGVNLIRVPHCGRNFEYFSEDPVLAGSVGVGVVEGIQSEGVIATTKHYVANNQERNRCHVSAEVDERALRELYLRPFQQAVDAGTGAIMTAYNRVNGTHMSDHNRLITQVLKDEWGFEGFVMSDWHGTESTIGAANGGLDLEMPGIPATEMFDAKFPSDFDPDTFEPPDGLPDITEGGLFNEPLLDALEADDVSERRLNDMAARLLRQMDRFDILTDVDKPTKDVETSDCSSLAERIAVRGTVLLQNDGVLPLSDDTDIALIGPNVHEAKLGGGGSSEITPSIETSPREGIESRSSGSVTIAQGTPRIENVSIFDMLPFDLDDENEAVETNAQSDPQIDDAINAAENADVAIVFVQDTATEGLDRESLKLPDNQDELVETIADVANQTVVVVNSSGPVELPWHDNVDAVLEAWYPGQADGDAMASVLYGDVDPSGRLPVTFGAESEYPATETHQHPEIDDEAHYEEGLFIGYRHFDNTETEPTYPFGHGESYTTYEYGSVTAVDDLTIQIPIENTGDRNGYEVVQAYVRPPQSGGNARPVRELAGFEAVNIDANETRTVEIELDNRSIERYDESGWTVDPGTYTIEVGRSVGDIRATTTIER